MAVRYKIGDQVTLVGRRYGSIPTGTAGVIVSLIDDGHTEKDYYRVRFKGTLSPITVRGRDMIGPGVSLPYRIGDRVELKATISSSQALPGTTGVIRRVDVEDAVLTYLVVWETDKDADWVNENWISPVFSLNINPDIDLLVDSILNEGGEFSDV